MLTILFSLFSEWTPSGDELNTSNTNDTTNESLTENENSSANYSNSTTIPLTQDSSVSNEKTKKKKVQLPPPPPPSKNSNKIYLYAIVPLAISLGIYFLIFQNTNATNIGKTIQQKLNCSLDVLKKEFPRQDDHFWKILRYGIEHVLNEKPTKPSVFLITYKDANLEREFKERILTITSDCMQTSNPVKLDHMALSLRKFQEDFGVVITEYKEPLEKSGVLMVSDVNKVKFCSCPAYKKLIN